METTTSIQLGKYRSGAFQFMAMMDTFRRFTMTPRTVQAAVQRTSVTRWWRAP